MLLTTQAILEGRVVRAYVGIVTGEAPLGDALFQNLAAGVRGMVGHHEADDDAVWRAAQRGAIEELTRAAEALGANAVIGITVTYETVNAPGNLLAVCVSGTAVILEPDGETAEVGGHP